MHIIHKMRSDRQMIGYGAYKRKRRANGRIRGRGGYLGDMWTKYRKYIPRGIGALAGGILGNASGGWNTGADLSKAIGWGKYQLAGAKHQMGGNSVVGNQLTGSGKPITVNTSDDETGDIYISHKEFVGNVKASGTIPESGNILSDFTSTNYAINCGLTNSFPWLSQIAQNFTMYELQGLIYEYRPTSGEFGAAGTNALGKVVMATQYDPDAPAFLSSIAMENYDYANSAKPSQHMLHGVETAKRQGATNMLYIRTGATERDKIFTDIGNFQISTEGIPLSGIAGSVSQAIVGELWVTYRVKLSRAQLTGSYLGNNIPFDMHQGEFNNALTQGYFNGITFKNANTNGPYFSAPIAGQLTAKKTNTIQSSWVQDNTILTPLPENADPSKKFWLIFPPEIIQGTYQITISAESLLGTTDLYVTDWRPDPATMQNCSLIDNGGDVPGDWYIDAPQNTSGAPMSATYLKASLTFFIQILASGTKTAKVPFVSNSGQQILSMAPGGCYWTTYVQQIPNNAVLKIT